MTTTSIFISYHKPSLLFKNDILVPIHVGRALVKKSQNYKWMEDNMIGDNTGDNISSKNPYYCELTAQYWAWKNCKSDYVGFFHYRRLLNLSNSYNDEIVDINSDAAETFGLDKKSIDKLIKIYDIILPEEYKVHPVGLPENTISSYEFYKRSHKKQDLDIVIDIIKKYYPEFVPAMDDYLSDNKSIFFNMFIMKKEIFNSYCSWLFDILFKSEKFIKISEDNYQKRVFGFLAERLLNIYIRYLVNKDKSIKVLNTGVINITPPPIEFDVKNIELGTQIYLKKNEGVLSRQTIDIVFATDNKYVQHCSAAIASILLNSDNSSYFRFHILDGGIKSLNKAKLLELRYIRDFSIEFYDMRKYDFSQFPLNRQYISVATYYRLLLLDLLPFDIEKVIYLDCDVILEKDIKELWNYDISDYLAGVVEDEGSISQQRRLNLPCENNYFNAGVLLLNIKALRNFDFKKKCIRYFEENEGIITLQDQDILNGVMNGKCKFLPLCWNTNSRIYLGNELEHNYNLQDEVIAGNSPGIIHYTDKNKPWHISCTHPLKNEYWKYLSYTSFKNRVLFNNLKACFSFILKVQNKNNSKVIKFLEIPVYKFEKGRRKSLKILGIPVFWRMKNYNNKKVCICGIKVYEKNYK